MNAERVAQAFQAQTRQTWSDADSFRGVRKVQQRLQRRAVRIEALRVSAVLVVLVGIFGVARAMKRADVAPPQVPVVATADGSRVELLENTTAVRTLQDTPKAVAVALDRGRARFDIAPNPQRRYVVQLKHGAITVLGTVFEVTSEESAFNVSVEHGRVAVECSARRLELVDGQSYRCAEEAEKEAPAPVKKATKLAPVTPARAPATATASATNAAEAVDAALQASDAARKNGDLREAARVLERARNDYPNDERAFLLNFTLGKVYSSLGEHAEAAAAFHRVTTWWPHCPLARAAEERERAEARQIATTTP